MDAGRTKVLTALGLNASPADDARVADTISAVNRESLVDLSRILVALNADRLVDGGVSRLRQAIASAVRLDDQEISGEERGANQSRSVDTLEVKDAAARLAQQLLTVQLSRFSLHASPDLPPRHLVSADATLAVLSHVVDQPGPGKLLLGTPSGLVSVDLDHQTVAPLLTNGLSQTVDQILPRQGWIAVTTRYQEGIEQLYSVPASLVGPVLPVVPVGSGPTVFAAVRPDTVWVQRSDGMVEEVGGGGQVVTGPLALPAGTQLEGVVNAGLVIGMDLPPQPVTLMVWDPIRRQVVRAIDTHAALVTAAAGDTVAWVTASDGLRLTTVSTGAVVAVSGPVGGSSGEGALSPDGRYFATAFIDAKLQGPLPAIIDVRTGALRFPRRPAGDAFDIGGFTWSPAGDRLYITASHAGFSRPGDALVWPVAGDDLSYLRLHGYPVLAIGAL